METHPAPARFARFRTLIVEDDQESRLAVSRQLTRSGHEVAACASAEEAAEIMQRQSFDLLLLDWMLPGQSGPDFCRILRAGESTTASIYVLLMTARDQSRDLEEALDAGANDYLIKPFEAATLNIRIRVAERQLLGLAEGQRSRQALRMSTLRAERLALVARKTQNGVVILDNRGVVEWSNEAFARMSGLRSDEMEGRPLTSLIEVISHGQSPDFFTAVNTWQAADGELELRCPPNPPWWAYYSITPLRDDKDGLMGLVCLFSDITTHKKGEEERFKAGKIESLGILAGGIAHDLNNILTVISGNISLIRSSLEPDQDFIHEHLDQADKAALRAAGLSRQLLTFAKGGTPVKQVTHLGGMIERTIRFALHGSSLTCMFGIDDNLRPAEVDTLQMEQVFNNLIINAREAMPHGGRIHVRARNEELAHPNEFNLPAGQYVRISISDNGPGISPDNLPRLFDPYFSTKPGGSGLGLTICFSVLSRHGGRITAETLPGGGSLFTMVLPAVVQADTNTTAPTPSIPAGKQVLIMDDEPGIREVTKAMLEMLGYRVITARDGKEALAAWREGRLRNDPVDVLILDATIPGGMGGVATLKALLREDPGVCAIICSGYSDESAMAELQSYGFKAALPKPFTGSQLGILLAKVLESEPMKAA